MFCRVTTRFITSECRREIHIVFAILTFQDLTSRIISVVIVDALGVGLRSDLRHVLFAKSNSMTTKLRSLQMTKVKSLELLPLLATRSHRAGNNLSTC